MTRHEYSDAERAEAVALALSIGPKAAAKRGTVPERTLYRWMAEVRTDDGRAARVIPVETRQEVAAALWEVVAAGTAEALRRIADPKTRAGELAQLLKVAAEQHALLAGGATSRNENINLNADVANGWGSEQYAEADLETREQAQALLREAIDEMLTGTHALRLAGASTASAIELDGLRIRANLLPTDAHAVQALLTRLEAAIDAGVDPSEIIASLTAKQLGDRDA